MKLTDIARDLKLTNLTPDMPQSQDDMASAFASDLLSDVLANAPKGGILVTAQVHLNVIAVAVHAEMTAVVFVDGRAPEQSVVDKAIEEGVILFLSQESAFDVAGRLYALGLRGRHA